MTEMVRLLTSSIVLAGLLVALSGAGEARADEASDAYTEAMATYNRGDLPGALPLFREAAEQGSADAQVWLGYLLDFAEENVEAVRWYRAAAEQGHADGLAGLADMYAKGEGVEKDLGEARLLYEKAADAGQDRAARVLAQAYKNGGLGVEPDTGKAAFWQSRAVELAGSKTKQE